MTDYTAAGFTCECGTFHEFDRRMKNRRDARFMHTCPKCGRRHRLYNLTAVLVAGSEPMPLPEGLFPDLDTPQKCARCHGTERVPDPDDDGFNEDGTMPCPDCTQGEETEDVQA